MTTVAVAGFPSTDANLYFSYAGHAPLLICRNGANAWRPAALKEASSQCTNAPLGVLPGSCFDQQQLTMNRGDRLLLYTDGLTEAKGDAGELFGSRRLLDSLADAQGADLADVKRCVLDAVARHTGDSEADDDITLLAVEIR